MARLKLTVNTQVSFRTEALRSEESVAKNLCHLRRKPKQKIPRKLGMTIFIAFRSELFRLIQEDFRLVLSLLLQSLLRLSRHQEMLQVIKKKNVKIKF